MFSFKKKYYFIIESIKDIDLKILKEKYNLTPQIIIAGEGPLENEIKSLINKLSLNNQFILTGNIEQTELFKVMAISDLIVIPSLFEAFGLAAIEAMYIRKAVILTNIDGLKEIGTNKINVIQVPVQDSPSIASAIVKLVNDKKYTNLLANKARESVSKFDVNTIVNQWVEIFERGK